jgi:Tfp pilus assembly protein PilF
MHLKPYLFFIAVFFLSTVVGQSPATFRESKKKYVTYPFSDPDPIPSQTAIYPYFRYDGFTNTPVQREWTVVELENDYIRVVILPEIGGKIWTAIDKTTGKPYLYDNKVIKFRDVAMRGPWTSGGLEPNYGIIGHTPNCATPVDYITRKNDDGSVSCFIGVLDLLTRTRWQIEINLPRDKAYFTTNSIWSNPTSLGQPYYHWMNTGIKTKGDLEFIFPGTHYIGHDGEQATWPVNESNGKKINFYEQNDFGTYKSYHVLGKQTDFFGAYWHDDKYGMVRYAPYDEKIGRKIWIWGLSRQGMIWEKILTDTDGQYAEIQTGRLFNQNASASSLTPFKHIGFTPHGTDRWTEYWYPVNNTRGMVVANESAALNVKMEGGWLKWYCSPVSFFRDELEIIADGKTILKKTIDAKPLKTIKDSVRMAGLPENISISLKGQQLEWSSDPGYKRLSRPLEAPKPYDWNSVEGLTITGKELMDQKMFMDAEKKLKAALAKDPNSLPAHVKMAELCVRNGDLQQAFSHARTAISFDAHHGAANYYYGLSASLLGKEADAFDGFSVASMSMEYRSAAYVEIAKLHARKSKWKDVLSYVQKAQDFNRLDAVAVQLVIVAHRMMGDMAAYRNQIALLGSAQPLNPFYKWEKARQESIPAQTPALIPLKNELPEETMLELASFYLELGLVSEVEKILSLLPANPLALYQLAYLKKSDREKSMILLKKANDLSTSMVFPFRTEFMTVLKWAEENSDHWKPTYYHSLLMYDKNKHVEALQMVRRLENKPDVATFYALRGMWNKNDPKASEADLKRAMAMDRQSWRYAKLLTQHFIEQKDNAAALTVVQQFKSTDPAPNFVIDMLLAKTMLLNQRYRESDSLLARMEIIPFEGATEGRVLYWESKMMQAVSEMKKKKFSSALTFIDQAEQWPENLGVGKPYETDLDNRLESFLRYKCHQEMNTEASDPGYLDRILSFQPGIHNTIRNFQPANHLVTKWANEIKGGGRLDWSRWMAGQKERYPEFMEIFNWVDEHGTGVRSNKLSDVVATDPWVRVLTAYASK